MSEPQKQTQPKLAVISALRKTNLSAWLPIAIGLAVASAVLLPLNLLTIQRFHHDEALYATWGLTIAAGRDPWLENTPIDKPPIFLYLVASTLRLLGPNETAARLPSLLATALTVWLTFFLGRRLFGTPVGAVAAWLVALSPFSLMFAPTAFTDPTLVVLIVASCLAASYGRTGWAGALLALALATKQQGLFFAPLVLGLLLLASRSAASGQSRITVKAGQAQVKIQVSKSALRFVVSILVIIFPVIAWDLSRNRPSAYLKLSLSNYGGLTTDLVSFVERWLGFVELLQYASGSVVLNWIFLAGLPLILIYDMWDSKKTVKKRGNSNSSSFSPPISPFPNLPPLYSSNLPTFQPSLLLTVFILFYLAIHAVLSFQIWDRYLLGLIPLLALLLARVLLLPWKLLQRAVATRQQVPNDWLGLAYGLSLAVVLALVLVRPVQDAANARFPLGSNSQDIHGIEQIVAYLQQNVGANNTLYHRWLGTHWRFYLWGYPYDLQFWDRPESLAVRVRPGYLLALPARQSDTLLRFALMVNNYCLHEVTRTYKRDGMPSIVLYRVEENC